MTILEQVRTQARVQYGQFRPQSPEEYFALRLAAKLGESHAAEHYVDLIQRHPEALLIVAYRRAVAHGRQDNLARRFHAEFEPLQRRTNVGNGDGKTPHRLAAIRIDRRAVAVAVLNGEHLSYAHCRQLSSNPGKAIASAVAFIERITEQFEIKSVVFEAIPNGYQKQRKLLQEAIARALAEGEVTGGDISKADLFRAFAHPAIRSRRELREIASEIWPILDEQSGGPWTHDAAALGLYVQIESLLENDN